MMLKISNFIVFFSLVIFCGKASAQITEMKSSPQWQVGCDSESKNQFGEKKRRYCWLFVNNLSNNGTLMDDNSWVIGLETLFEIDKAGLHLIKPKKSDDLCSGRPRKIAVDGRRIDQLSEKEQVKTILNGRRLVWEKQALWPYCGIAPHGTYLDGIQKAVSDLQLQWAGVNQMN